MKTELTEIKNQTPIEIALGIDEKGMTTAKRLYEFLELRKGDYSRWYKTNILENQFADENIDYEVLRNDAENSLGGRPTQDFKLTASFAKKLSMLQKNEKGEQAREYFIRVEDGAKKISSRLHNLSPELQAIFLHDERIQKIDTKVDEVNQDLQDFKQDMPILGVEESKITSAVSKKGVQCLGGKHTESYKDSSLRKKVYSDIYRQLKREFGVASYKAIKRSQCDKAVSIIENYEMPFVLEEQIRDTNAQMHLDTEKTA